MLPFIVTGATGSMGAVAVRELAKEGYPVIMACRNLAKGESVRKEILSSVPEADLRLMCLNLDTQKGVREFLGTLGDCKLSGIFNNAGVISRNYSVTEDGYEHTMAVNFVNPALLTLGLLDKFIPGANIVNMVSLTTRFGRIGSDWANPGTSSNNGQEYSLSERLKCYSNTKLALLLFTIELARRNPELHINVSDPGIVDSNMISMGKWYDPLADIFFRPFISSPEKGVAPALKAIHSDKSLQYFVGRKSSQISNRYLSDPMSEKLWSHIRSIL